MSGKWLVQVFGVECSDSWEISIVREDNVHGRKSWGWFDENKLLVSHNGWPCRWPIIKPVWDRMIQAAREVCDELNAQDKP